MLLAGEVGAAVVVPLEEYQAFNDDPPTWVWKRLKRRVQQVLIDKRAYLACICAGIDGQNKWAESMKNGLGLRTAPWGRITLICDDDVSEAEVLSQ